MPAWSGLFDGVFGQPHALLNEPNSIERTIARTLAAQANIGIGEVAMELNGVPPGAAALATVAQVSARQADGMNQGGQVPITTQTIVDRVTTAADVTRFNAQLQPTFAPTTYPPDLSGNGGGGKAGTIN